jgi:acyl-coenzyme A thioesterase 1/2/4
MGLGEPKVGKDQKDSPFNRRSTKEDVSGSKNPARSDLKVALTLNHTIYFHNPVSLRADEWLFMEANTSSAFGGRVLIHSKIFSRDNNIVATCTQEVINSGP